MQSQWIATFLHKMKREREKEMKTNGHASSEKTGMRQQAAANRFSEWKAQKNDEMRISALHTYEFVCIIICFSVLFFYYDSAANGHYFSV